MILYAALYYLALKYVVLGYNRVSFGRGLVKVSASPVVEFARELR